MVEHREFTVPKEKQRVTVHFPGGEKLSGSIFLEYQPGATTAYQKVASFLEDRTQFFPLVLDGGKPQIIAKNALKMLETDFAGEEPTFSLKHIENIIAVLTDGSRIEGQLLADVPEERDRLSDCLNLPERYLSLRLSGKLLFINKSLIQKVLSSSKD